MGGSIRSSPAAYDGIKTHCHKPRHIHNWPLAKTTLQAARLQAPWDARPPCGSAGCNPYLELRGGQRELDKVPVEQHTTYHFAKLPQRATATKHVALPICCQAEQHSVSYPSQRSGARTYGNNSSPLQSYVAANTSPNCSPVQFNSPLLLSPNVENQGCGYAVCT